MTQAIHDKEVADVVSGGQSGLEAAMPRPIEFIRVIICLLMVATATGACINGITQILLPAQLEGFDPSSKVERLAFLGTFLSAVSVIGMPLGGALSDRTRSRFGKRAPWILGLSLLWAALMMGLGASDSFSMFTIVYFTIGLVASMYMGAYIAVMPDRVPTARLGAASTIMGFGPPLGALIGVNIAGHFSQFASYAVLGLLMFLSSLILVVGAPEPSSLKAPLKVRIKEPVRQDGSNLFRAFRSLDFTLAFVSRFLMCLSAFTVGGYLFYMLTDYIGVANVPGGNVPAAVSKLVTITGIGWVTVAALCGWLADKMDRRKMFVAIAAVGLSAAMAAPVISPTWNGMVVYALISGAATGTYFSVDLALMSLVLPHQETAGRDLGILNVAGALPQLISAGAAGALIKYAGGYQTLLLAATVCAVLSAVTAFFIQKVR